MTHGKQVMSKYIISVHVFGWQRYTCLGRTLTSLNEACYPIGSTIDLTVWFDKGYNSESFDVALNASWSYGKKTLKTFKTSMGVRGIWMNFWTAPEYNEIRFVFEDDTEVSRGYFDYFINVMNNYFFAAKDADPKQATDALAAANSNIVGVALYHQVCCYNLSLYV